MLRERKYYTEEFKEKVLAVYNNSNETAAEVANRFHVNLDTVKSWVYRKRTPLLSSVCVKNAKFATSETKQMEKKENLPPEAMEARIKELEQQLALEKMRAESLDKMIDIAERELQIDIRKKSGAKQSSR